MKTAWFGEQSLKDRVMEQLQQHKRLDEIVQGTYFDEDGRGCHLGCLTHIGSADDVRAATERMFGIPIRVAYWLEAVFEGLPNDECAQWVLDSTEAIPAGADLSRAHHELAYWLLGPDSPSATGNGHPSVRDAIGAVRALHDRARHGDTPSHDEWSAAASAAWSADSAARSADSAAWSAAWSAASSAARSAASAAWSAESAASSAAWSAADSAAWTHIAAKSIEIFRACPVAECEDCDGCIEHSMSILRNNLVTGERVLS